MHFNEIAFTIITILISGVAYFLKGVHSDIKALAEEQKRIIASVLRLMKS